jgi:uncharacterized protein
MKMLGRILVMTVLLVVMPFAASAQTLDELPFAKKLTLAKVGDEDAQLAVGADYESGAAGSKDLAEAARWYRQAGLQGSVEAQYRLARIVAKGAKGLKQDYPTALKLYQAAAGKNHAGAMNALGQMIQNGQGTTADPAKAAEWYKKAADTGLADAENNLGMLYLSGKGVNRDLKEAFRLFELAANQGDAWGLNNVGGMYESGWGTTKDKEKALDFYKQSAAMGNPAAADNLKRLMPDAKSAPAATAAPAAKSP